MTILVLVLNSHSVLSRDTAYGFIFRCAIRRFLQRRRCRRRRTQLFKKNQRIPNDAHEKVIATERKSGYSQMKLRSDSEDTTFTQLNSETSANSSSSTEDEIIFKKSRRSQRVSFASKRLMYGLLRNNCLLYTSPSPRDQA